MPRTCRSVHLHGKKDSAVVTKNHMTLGGIFCVVLTRGAQCNQEIGERVTVRKTDVVKKLSLKMEDGT